MAEKNYLAYRDGGAREGTSIWVGWVLLFGGLSWMVGEFISYVLVVGWGLGDAWIIRPEGPLYWWLCPFMLFVWPVVALVSRVRVVV